MNKHEMSMSVNHRLSDLVTVAAGFERDWFTTALMRARHELFSEFHELTPEIAQYLLDHNDDNRVVNQTILARYSSDIAAGNWSANGEPIIVSKDGYLNDGQHRCLGVVKTGVSIYTAFSFGVERDTRATVDQGFARTAGGRLQMRKVANANVASAIAGYIWQYDKFGMINRQQQMRPTQQQVEDTYFRNEEKICNAVILTRKRGVESIGKSGLIGFCHVIFQRKNPEKADEFIGRLIDGVGLDADSPIYLCRQRLITMKTQRATTEEKAEIVFRGWIAFISNVKKSRIQLKERTGNKIKKLPEV